LQPGLFYAARDSYPVATPAEVRNFGFSAKRLINLGAGEGIRTLDPNLGKVVLYP
jgi:hypothetical protein